MKLFVDDVRDAPDGWVLARKVEEAIRIISQNKMEEISLDHDIENRPSNETFKPVAYFVAVKYGTPAYGGGRFAPKITIHSVNSVGAKQMIDILKDRGISATYTPYSVPRA